MNLELIQERFNNDERNITIDRDEIIDFALDYFKANEKARWNGRQIRNACHTALALAEFKAQGGNYSKVLDPNAEVRLAVDNFQTVSKAYLDFTKYLKQLYGIHEDVRAKELGLRARETIRPAPAEFTQQTGFYGANIPQSYYHAPVNPVQTVPGQFYPPAPMIGTTHPNPGLGAQHFGQQAAYYGNPSQVNPAGPFMTYGAPGQAQSGQTPQQSQDFVGMPFQAPGNVNQQVQSRPGQSSPPNTVSLPQPHPEQAQ